MTLVKRCYKVGMRFKGDSEKEANNLVLHHQKTIQDKILSKNMVDHAYELLDEYPNLSGNKGARHLAKKVADGSNIGQVSTTYVLSAVNGAIDREKKLAYLFELFDEYPKEAVSWLVFQRTPFIETSLANILGVNFEYSRNLIYSAGRNMISAHGDIILPKLDKNDYLLALDELILEINEKITEMRLENRYIKRIQSFLNKLIFLNKNREFLAMCLDYWLSFEINNQGNSRWKSLKKLSKEFTFMLGYKRPRHLFSAIRGIVVHALSSKLYETVKNLCETVKIRDLIAKPYRKQRKILAPVNLIMGSKYVITRPGNGKILTQLAIKHNKFTLGIRNSEKRGHIIHGDVIISNRINKMLKRGATISSLSIRSGIAPGYKLIVTLNLQGPEDAFISLNFMKTFPDLKLKAVNTIGLDVNRVGPYILVFSQQIELPKTIVTICDRYTKLGNIISNLSKTNSTKPSIKLQGELNRVYIRRGNLLKEIKNQCKLLCSAVLIQSGATEFNIEDLNISARGKRGSLAKAILSMPDELNIFEKAVILASKHTQTQIELKLINPFKTSSRHYKCGGRLLRSWGNWDICSCKKCNIEVNTHLNAALHIRDGGVAA